jgi:phage-related protein
MITFTVPGGYPITTGQTVTVDRYPNLSKQVSVQRQGTGESPLEQVLADGINPLVEKFSFSINNRPAADVQALINWFTSMKGTTKVTFTFPEETKNLVITNWTVSLGSSKFYSMQIETELAYL